MSFVSVFFTGAQYSGGQTPHLAFSPGTTKAKVVLVQQLMDDITTSHVQFLDNVSSWFGAEVDPAGYLVQNNTLDWQNKLFMAILKIDD
jgi:hypothetical protein